MELLMGRRESRVESPLVRDAREIGILSYKISGIGDVGKPDRLFFRRGKCAFVEVKAPGEKPEPIQLRTIQKLNEEGTPAAWFDHKKPALDFLKQHLL